MLQRQILEVKESEEEVGKDMTFMLGVEFTKNSVEAEIASLELLTNICSSDDWETDQMSDESAAFPVELKHFVVSVPIAKLTHMCLSPDSGMIKSLEESPAIFAEMVDFLQDRTYRALACLANIFGAVNPEEFPVPADQIWTELGRIFTEFSSHPDQLKAQEGCVAAMRGFVCHSSSLDFVSSLQATIL